MKNTGAKKILVDGYLNTFSTLSDTKQDFVEIDGRIITRHTAEFWSNKQRQANSLHEISYRACFKAQLPAFFIKSLSEPNDVIYDCFNGRGTTTTEAALLSRQIIGNDINPLSQVLAEPRLFVPDIAALSERLKEIHFDYSLHSDIDLSMFYHKKTESEIASLKNYFLEKEECDSLDKWIRMIATNRLTGHSKNFFSVYTLPPNFSVSQRSQIKINEQKKQTPDYKDVKQIILKKSKDLLKNINPVHIKNLRKASQSAVFITGDARHTTEIKTNSVQLTVTSPPFLNIVQYAEDNWLRNWFNNIDSSKLSITMSKTVFDWSKVMLEVLQELYRITKPGGFVAFEVGEINNGKIKLDEITVPLGVKAGFECTAILINDQSFTKTANIWGISNNAMGTNTNRLVVFHKNL